MKTCWLVLLLLCLSGAAHADRDIVYAARYYAPPGSHQTSHFHLYRINPDGTGKTQITFGSAEEGFPHWTADGKQITFVVYHEVPPFLTLCRVDADGSHRRVIQTLSGLDRLPGPVTPGCRLENSFPVLPTDNDAKHVLVSTRTGQRRLLTVPEHDDFNDALSPLPGGGLVYGANNHNSTVGTDYAFYRLNPDSGTLLPITKGQFLAWSPDGTRFCVARGRGLVPYDRRRDPPPAEAGETPEAKIARLYRLVWAAPLLIRAAGGGPMRQLTPRLSYVTGADWRRTP